MPADYIGGPKRLKSSKRGSTMNGIHGDKARYTATKSMKDKND